MKSLTFASHRKRKSSKVQKLSKYCKKIDTWDYKAGDVNPYLRQVLQLKETIPEWDDFFNSEKTEERGNNWIRLEVLGQPLCEKYAWAIPDQRALNIIAQFQPIIELGAGNGYWGHLLKKQNVHIRCCDHFVDHGKLWTLVERSGPPILQTKEILEGNYTLMLCYPDEAEDLSYQCLQYYDGKYIIHVGELAMTGTYSGYPQAPFGRTTNSQFQIQLMQDFHCILLAELPRFPFSRDCISVWKRTKIVPGRNLPPPEEEEDDNDEEQDDEEGDDEEDDDDDDEEEEEDIDDSVEDGNGKRRKKEKDYWVDIPPEERLVWNNAIPSLAHLLQS
jgi:hypothetical protein